MKELIHAADHVRAHQGAVMVFKIGGSCLSKLAKVRALARQIATVQALGGRPCIVHGGGPQTDALQLSLGETPQMVDGRRVTTPTALRALRMATAGEINGDLSAAISHAGAPAVGICAADAGIISASRRPPLQTSCGEVDFGAVGRVESLQIAPLLTLLDEGVTPVICPPVSDQQGGFLNLNADTLAAELAVALGAAKLVLLTGEAGVLEDAQDPDSAYSVLLGQQLEQLRNEGRLGGGMHVKATAIQAALQGGVPRVHVISGLDPEALLVELYTSHGSGTLITLESA